MKKNWMTTIAGLMVGLGQIPLGLQYAHLPFALPLWWNAAQFPLWLVGTVGGVLVGVAAKGQDEHTTIPQAVASTVQQEANAAVKAADQPATATETGTTVAFVAAPAPASKKVQ